MRKPHRRRYEREVAWYEGRFPDLFPERLSVRHPEYDRLEGAFWFALRPPRNSCEFGAQGRFIADVEGEISERQVEESLASLNTYLQAAEQHHSDLDAVMGRLFDETDDAAAFRALDLLGLEALFEPHPVLGRTEEDERRLNLIQRLVQRRITRWYWGAWFGPVQGRAQATAALRRFLMAFLPDRRGQRNRIVGDAMAVYERYCRKLFRLLRARRLLDEWRWRQRGPREERIAAVAESCGLTVRELGSFLSVRKYRHAVRAPISLERAACECVAIDLGLDWKTVAKVRGAMEERWLPPIRPPFLPPPSPSPK